MKHVWVLGQGAREHALCWKIAQSKELKKLYCSPGNAGVASIAEIVDIALSDAAGVVRTAKGLGIDLVVIGPEQPLVDGLADVLRDEGIAVFGCSREAAQLEGSKIYAKELMRDHNIPTAAFKAFDNAEAAEAYIRERNCSLVVKADGLAAGKGVVVAKTSNEALSAVQSMMRDRVFKDAGARVVIEDCLVGEEISYHVISDGKRFVPLAAAQDHKRLLDGDQGPNTGGMGAYSPPALMTRELEQKIIDRIVTPTLDAMAKRNAPFLGALFVGVMVVNNEPYTLEYNVRFGDPETVVLMMRLGNDVLPWLWGAANGRLPHDDHLNRVSAIHTHGSLAWRFPSALCAVLAAEGYPQSPRQGDVVTGVGEIEVSDTLQVFHAGTRISNDHLLTAGGRVLTVAGADDTLESAHRKVYRAIEHIDFKGKQYRTDIGYLSLETQV